MDFTYDLPGYHKQVKWEENFVDDSWSLITTKRFGDFFILIWAIKFGSGKTVQSPSDTFKYCHMNQPFTSLFHTVYLL